MEEGVIQASDAHQRPLPAHASACGDTQTGGLVAGISNGDGGPALLGRIRECHVLDRLLESARAGQSRVLVLRGESGVGKSALLEYLAGRASGCHVARAAGPRSEMALAYAGLHQLCAPVLDLRQRLPTPQRGALATVFGLSAEPPPDRFVPGLAVLGLLSENAEERPLVCVVDDAQWLDNASALALAFVARRTLAESIGLVFAVHDEVLPGRLDQRVRDRVVYESRGNSLSLLALARGFAPAELAGGFALPDVMPLVNLAEADPDRCVSRAGRSG